MRAPKKTGNTTNRTNKGEVIIQEVSSNPTRTSRSEAPRVTMTSSSKPPQKKLPTKTVTKAKPTLTKTSKNSKKSTKSAVKSAKATTKAGKKKVKIKAKVNKKATKVVAKKPPPATASTEPQGPPDEMNALAILAQNFMKIVLNSKDGTVDIQQAADRLQVPKRRIYDITNVLEGSGLTQKKSKNVISFTSRCSKDSDIPTAVEQKQTEIGNLVEEEAILDVWISKLTKQVEAKNKTLSMSASDVIKALYYPRDGSTPMFYDAQSSQEESSLQTTVAIHAPLGSFINTRQEENDYEHCYKLHLATEADIEESTTIDEINKGGTKRRMGERQNGGFLPSKKLKDDESNSIRVHYLPSKIDKNSKKVVCSGVQTMEQSNMVFVPKVVKSPPPIVTYYDDENDYNVLEDDEGVSDFFA